MKSDMLPLCLASDPCDCGDRIRHFNGGNYHASTWLKLFREGKAWCLVLVEKDSREIFPNDKFERIIHNGAHFVFEDAEYHRDPFTFRYQDARIIAEG